MDYIKKIFLLIPLTIIFALIIPSQTQAAEFHFKSYTLTQEETINDDIYAIGDTVIINGVVNGDLVVIADVIQVNGTITGDTYLIGTTIDIDANIYGNSYILGNNTTINGLIVQNTYIVSSIVNYNAETSKDLFSMFLEGNIKGYIGDDLRTIGSRATVDSVIKGDVILIGDQYTTSEEKITGNIYYNSTLENIAKEQGIEWNKSIHIEEPTFSYNWNTRIFFSIINFLSICMVGVILIVLTPVKTSQIAKKITNSTNEFLKSLLVGLGIAILIPFPLFILFISIIGTPTAILITGVLFFILIFGRIWVETAFGAEILELFGVKGYRPFKSFLTGRALSTIVSLIPVVNTFYSAIVVLVALGAIVRTKKDCFRNAKALTKK